MKSHDREKIVDLYLSGWGASAIAEEVGCARTTVYRHLDAWGIDARNVRGRARGEFCGRGVHRLLDEHGRDTENVRSNGRGKRWCGPCEAIREALRRAIAECRR